jgi:hypothetical protein
MTPLGFSSLCVASLNYDAYSFLDEDSPPKKVCGDPPATGDDSRTTSNLVAVSTATASPTASNAIVLHDSDALMCDPSNKRLVSEPEASLPPIKKKKSRPAPGDGSKTTSNPVAVSTATASATATSAIVLHDGDDALMCDPSNKRLVSEPEVSLPPVKKKKRSQFFTLSGPLLPLTIEPPVLPLMVEPPVLSLMVELPALPISPVTSDVPDDGSISNMYDH